VSILSIKYLEHANGIEKMAKLFYEEKLIPVFGSGFTQGCYSKGGQVPNSKETIEKMKEFICRIKKIDLGDADFNKISDRFFAIVPKTEQLEFLRDYFTGVNISGYRSDFIELPWPYIYTLNIDDGIENTGCYTPMLPYKNANVFNKSIKILYKLHGDALHEVKYKDEPNIVFSVNQYIESLTAKENATIINSITSDYKQKTLLFIGCSLSNEPDLRYVYTNVKADISLNILRCVVRTKKLTVEDEMDLEDYGINTVILADDYELFYRDFKKEYEKLKSKDTSSLYRFINPKHKDVSNDKKLTINYFSGQNIFSEDDNIFYKSGMQIIRTCTEEIEEQLKTKNSVVIRGRRFSGKSFILSSLIERYAKYSVLFFPSSSSIDEDVLQIMFKNYKDAFFFFDSNSLNEYAYHFIANSEELLSENSNKLLVAINSNDSYLFDSLKAEMIHIPPFFDDEELSALKPLSDKFGLIRRKNKKTNIDYLKELSEKQKINFSIFNKLPKCYSKEEKVLLVLLSAKDKLYFSDINALNIRFKDVDVLINRLNGIVEKVPVTKGEKSRHSTEKLVHNSKYYLLSILRQLTFDEIIESIEYIVSHLVNDTARKRLYVETVLFDTLNQLFGYKQGAGELIFKIYNSLEPYLNQDMDYWLQRAKSIYRIRPDSYDDLLDAYKYAKKALDDGNVRLEAKSALTTSLICCLLAKLVKEDDERFSYEIEAIHCSDMAINSDYFSYNHGNLKDALNVRKRGNNYAKLIIDVCDQQLNTTKDIEIAKKSVRIKQALEYLVF